MDDDQLTKIEEEIGEYATIIMQFIRGYMDAKKLDGNVRLSLIGTIYSACTDEILVSLGANEKQRYGMRKDLLKELEKNIESEFN